MFSASMWLMHNFAFSSGSSKLCDGSNNQEGRCQEGNLFWRGDKEQSFFGHINPQSRFSKAKRGVSVV